MRQFLLSDSSIDVSSEKLVTTLLQIAAICMGPLPINYSFFVKVPAAKSKVNRPMVWTEYPGVIWTKDCELLSTFEFLYLKNGHLKLDTIAAGLVNSSVFCDNSNGLHLYSCGLRSQLMKIPGSRQCS